MQSVIQVWILILFSGGGQITTSIDGIASRDECEMLGRRIVAEATVAAKGPRPDYRCYSVAKLRPR